MQTLEIYGSNQDYRLGETIEYFNGFPIIHQTKSNFNISSLLSYFIGGNHTIAITSDGIAHTIGNNFPSLPRKTYDHFSKEDFPDKQNHYSSIISAASGSNYKLYMISKKRS